MYFDQIEKRIARQETIRCPFCDCGYISQQEVRKAVKCPICKGHGNKAATADKYILQLLPTIDTLSTQKIEEYIEKLPAMGFYRLEFRIALNKRKRR